MARADRSRRAPSGKPGQRRVRVALIGWGTIGSGVIKMMRGSQDALSDRLGAPLELARVADLDLTSKRSVRVPKSLLTKDTKAVLKDPDIDIVVELIGGLEPARTFVLEAIANGKAVVTANKALLAHHGREIFTAAEAAGVGFGFEASVGGGIPIIRTLREALGGDRHSAVFGIMNGTSNYILSTMAAKGDGFSEVLAAAQASGLAEADPTYDVDGIDAAHKLALLVQLAFGVHIPLDAIHTEGIREVDELDMAYAKELGYEIKLLAIAKQLDDSIEARVHPTMIPTSNLLAGVDGAMNAVCLHGDALGPSMYYGAGAGMMPTATAVVGDILDLARDRLGLGGPRLPPLGFAARDLQKARVRPIGDVVSEYYLRIQAKDQPGVLAEVAGHLGRAGISVESVVQRGRKSDGAVPMVFRTHETRERDLRRALAKVAALKTIKGTPVAIRIEENPG